MARIPVFTASGLIENELDVMRGYYKAWRETNAELSAPYFQLYKVFKERDLLKLDGGPIKLFLYYGFAANNSTGESWYSVETIAEYFGVQERTVNKWNNTLKEAGLIHREKDNKMSHTTFLLPFSDTIRKIQPRRTHESDDQALVEDLIGTIEHYAEIFGPITNVIHLFHWGKKKNGSPSPTNTLNQLMIMTDRDGILTGHLYTFIRSTDARVSKLNLPANYCVFQSPYQYRNNAITGLAASHTIDLPHDGKPSERHVDLLQQLAKVDSATFWRDLPTVNYGKTPDIVESDDEYDESPETGVPGKDGGT